MNKIKILMVAMMAAIMGVSFTSCSDDDDDTTKSNYEQFQQTVRPIWE